MPDTIPGSTATTQSLLVGASGFSAIDSPGDKDWWRVALLGGYGYQVWVAGASSADGTLADPFLQVYNALGVLQTFNDDGSGLNAFVYLTPPSNGTWYLSAEESGNNATGTYTITLLADELSSNASLAPATVNAATLGNIGSTGDTADWFRVYLNAGTTYQFDVIGSAADGTAAGLTLADPALSLHSSSGSLLVTDQDSGLGRNDRILFTPTVTGNYFVDVENQLLNTSGSYRVIINSSPIIGGLALGTSLKGTVDFVGDADSYGVALTAGHTYDITLTGDTLSDPYLEIADSDVAVLNGDDDSGPGLDSTLRFVPEYTGSYYLTARSSRHADTGTYSIRINETDTILGSSATAQTLAADSFGTSAIDFTGDTDWWRASLLAGYGYQVWLEGASSGAGTLADPYLQVFNALGGSLTANDNGSGADALLYLTPPLSGTYYLSAEEAGNNAIGSYRITLLTDELASTASAARATINGATFGTVGSGEDVSDWFGVNLTAGTAYQVDLVGSGNDGGPAGLTLANPWLALRGGGGALFATDDDSGIGLNARLIFTPGISGLHFLQVEESVRAAAGSYRLIINADPVVGGIALGVPLNDSISFAGDLDTFMITLTAGVTYNLALTGGTLADPFLEVRDGSGAALRGDDNSGPGLDAALSFIPLSTGTYYVGARSAGYADTGTYTLRIDAVDAPAEGFPVNGSPGADALVGDDGDDTITGLDGADTMTGFGGDDRIDGGAQPAGERDLARYAGPISDYTFTRSGSTTTVSDGVPGGDGIDTLFNVEKLLFTDMSVNLTVQATAGLMTQATLDRICELYVGFFGRVPAADGLEGWINQFNDGKRILQIADDFYSIGSGAQLRAITGYWDFVNGTELGNADYVRIVYRNVLGREGQTGGINYWSSQLDSGEETRGSLVCKMLDSANTYEGDPTWGWVADLVDDKVTMSKRVAVDWGLNYALTAEALITKGVAIASAVDSPGPTPGFADIPIKVFDFAEATAIVGVNPAHIDLIA